jgi:hypothetical protein
MRACLSFLGAILLWHPSHADELDLSFNSDALRVQYVWPFGDEGLQLDGGWLHHKDNGEFVHVGLHLSGLASEGNDPVLAGLGVRLAYADGDVRNQDGFALGLGGFLRYTVPGYNRFSVGGHAYFAPEVLSLGDSEGYQDYMLRVSYNVIRSADVYLGARYVRGEYDGAPDARYDTGMHIGINLRF